MTGIIIIVADLACLYITFKLWPQFVKKYILHMWEKCVEEKRNRLIAIWLKVLILFHFSWQNHMICYNIYVVITFLAGWHVSSWEVFVLAYWHTYQLVSCQLETNFISWHGYSIILTIWLYYYDNISLLMI